MRLNGFFLCRVLTLAFLIFGPISIFSERLHGANMQLVESNKATVPSWISLEREKIYWLEERLEFVYSRQGLSALALGIKQTQLNTFHSFTRALSLTVFSELLEQGISLSEVQQKKLKQLLVSKVDKISYPNFKIADIYYRKWKSLEPGKADSIDVYCLAYLSFEEWQRLKNSLGVELKKHKNRKIRELWKNL